MCVCVCVRACMSACVCVCMCVCDLDDVIRVQTTVAMINIISDINRTMHRENL